MPQFRYKAARRDGSVVADCITGNSEAAVRSQLERQGLLIFDLAGSRTGSKKPAPRWFRGRLSLREFLIFNQEFLALIKAGLPILKTFDLLAERALNLQFQAVLHGVRMEIRGGASISEAMAQHPIYFSDLYRASLRSGEHTGGLVEVLQRYIGYLKMVIGVREKVAKALAYPVFLVAVGISVVAFLLTYVMPTFAEVYGQNKTDLPAPTAFLLTAIESSNRWLPWIIGAIIALGVCAYQWRRTETGREQSDWLSLRLPIIGDVLLKNQIIRMTRTLSTILAGGIPLMQALQIASGSTTNRVMAKALERATERVRHGMGLAVSLKQEKFLPQMTLEMIEVGETTGSLEAMLRDVAEFQEGELDLRLSQLTTWIEPVLLLVMGFVVGGIVIVMYLPIFRMAGTI